MSIVVTTLDNLAPLSGYDLLVAALANWTHRTDLAGMMPEFVRLAESRIARDLRLSAQLRTVALTVPAGSDGVALPAGWLEFKRLARTREPQHALMYSPCAQLTSCYDYGIEAGRLILVKQAVTLTVEVVYYARFESLTTAGTNWLSINYPSVYLFAVLIECMFYTQNTEQLQLYSQRYQAEVAQLQQSDARAASSGSALRIQPRGFR